MAALVAAICGIYGLVIGSFLNVVIWRVPRKESVVRPPSRCPGCDERIPPRDNVPVVSWLLLRGRCRRCATPISVRYPIVELTTGALFAAVGARFHDSFALPAYLLFAGALVALSAIDLEHYLLPNRIVYPVGIAGVPLLAFGAALDDDWAAFLRGLAGGAVAFACFFVIHLIAPHGMGFGDVRLSAVLGMFLGYLGWGYVAAGLFAGFLFGAIVGVAVIAVVGMRGRKYHIPFGPFLALGALTLVLVGDPILDWYRGLAA